MKTAAWQARHIAGGIVRRIPWLRRQLIASTDYKIVTEEEARNGNDAGWLAGLTARRQANAYALLLSELRSGRPRIDFQVAVDAVRASDLQHPNILEVGCGNGYYAEVFDQLLGQEFSYTGLDYSPAMVDSARANYPSMIFRTGDATALPFENNAFDIVFNGVSLMHTLDFRKAVSEGARVAAKACVFHSVPVFQSRKTTFLRKYAYGAPVCEIIFNEADLTEIFAQNGLALHRVWQSIPYDVGHVTGEVSTAKTFLCYVHKEKASSP